MKFCGGVECSERQQLEINFWGEKNLKIVYSRNQGFQKPENTPKADER